MRLRSTSIFRDTDINKERACFII